MDVWGPFFISLRYSRDIISSTGIFISYIFLGFLDLFFGLQ